MNKMRNAAIILDETLTTVKVNFHGGKGVFTFLCSKLMAQLLHPDDLVVAEKVDGSLAIVRIQSIDEESEIQLEDPLEYSFIVQKVNRDYLDGLKEKLATAEKALKDQQRKRLREQVRNELILEHKSVEI